MVTPSSVRPRLIPRVFGVFLALLLLQHVLHLRQPYSVPRGDPKAVLKPSCASLDGLDDLLVILKTGANEAREKIPVHFDTTLRCVPHYAIYSDLEEQIAGHRLQNALDELDPEIIASHPDFHYYRRLQEGGREAFSTQEVARWSAAENTERGRDSPGWRLDKWKFLPVAEKALKHRPEAKWFVFIEADTYVIWSNLLEWLYNFYEDEPYYLGQQMQIGDVVFAYGGSGFIISNTALKMLVAQRRSHLKSYDNFTGNHWAGDCVLGTALADAGVNLLWSWPNLLNGQPIDMDYNSGFAGSETSPWCHYAASYHHLTPADISRFSDFEHKWRQQNGRTLRHKDVFRQYILPQLIPERTDWDNLSDHLQKEYSSFDACRNLCERQADCVQFSVSGQRCKTSTTIKLGRPSPSATAPVTSGWMMDRVHAFMERMDSSCVDQDWIQP
ncbi:hypothetical protein BJ170DRAFT_581117 [Xylariales sp. AK1849]|nr:hypothetical protein BJ170DRAFT_581117 [Xylariales sp. AK1849]